MTDEFIEPIAIEGRPRLAAEDAVIFFNFRPDRGRQLTQKLLASRFDLTTMTNYRDDFDVPVAFAEQEVTDTVAEVLSEHGVSQLHVAETEKYAHVTYFFNGDAKEWPGGDTNPRAVAAGRPQLRPQARDVGPRGDRPLVDAIGSGEYGFAVLNFANPDMVGHTGSIPATVRAVETVDECLGRVVDAVSQKGGVALVTADHGNAEQMLAEDGTPHTAHTSNPVPLVTTDRDVSLHEGGELSDLAPTVLALLGITKPVQMTGKSLFGEPLGATLRPTWHSNNRTSEYCDPARRRACVHAHRPHVPSSRSSTTCCASSAIARSRRT